MQNPRRNSGLLRWRDMVLFSLAAVLFTGCSGKSEPQFIGQIVPLSGSDRDRGLAAMRGAQLAAEEVNADSARWINGRKVAVIHADSESNPKRIGDQAVRLIAVNRLTALLGGTTRSEMDAIASVVHSYTAADEFKAIVLGSSGTIGTPAVSEAFSLGVAPTRRVKIIDQFLAETLKPAKIALVVDGNDAGFSAMADRLGRLLGERKLNFELMRFLQATDLPALVQQFGGTPPTVVFFGSSKDAIIMRQAIDPPLPMVFAGDEADAQRFMENAKDDNGPYWVGTYATEAVSQEFVNKFTEKFKSSPSVEAMMSYDAARVLFSAALEVKSFAPSKLAMRFKQPKSFDTLIGPIEFGKDDQIANGPAFVLQAKKGHGTVVWKSEASTDK